MAGPLRPHPCGRVRDTNRAQYVLPLPRRREAEPLRRRRRRPSRCSRGAADVRNILDFARLPERDGREASEQNYRSTQRILDSAHASCGTTRPGRRRSSGPIGRAARRSSSCRLTTSTTRPRDAREIERLRREGDVTSARDVAVLPGRTRSRAIEDVFLGSASPTRWSAACPSCPARGEGRARVPARLLRNPVDSVAIGRVLTHRRGASVRRAGPASPPSPGAWRPDRRGARRRGAGARDPEAAGRRDGRVRSAARTDPRRAAAQGPSPRSSTRVIRAPGTART